MKEHRWAWHVIFAADAFGFTGLRHRVGGKSFLLVTEAASGRKLMMLLPVL